MYLRYFVKAPITGWHEVSKPQFEAFVAHKMKDTVNIPENKKSDYLKTITRIEEVHKNDERIE